MSDSMAGDRAEAVGRAVLHAYESIPYDNDLSDEDVHRLLGNAALAASRAVPSDPPSCFPSLGDRCGNCHRCTDPAVASDHTTSVLRKITAIYQAGIEGGDTEMYYPHPEDTLDAIWDVLNQQGPSDRTTTTEDAARAMFIAESGQSSTFAAAIWDESSSDAPVKNYWRRIARALAAAGLLATAHPDTTTEWGVRWRSGAEFLGTTEEHARHLVTVSEGVTLLRRDVALTDWTEADHG